MKQKCNTCYSENIDNNFSQDWRNTDFSGIIHISTHYTLKVYFCSKVCKTKFNIKREKNKPFLAELDEAMNYCEYFQRKKWNEWFYIRDNKSYPVSWLWDYKNTPDHFYKWFRENFGDISHFKLHNRYI